MLGLYVHIPFCSAICNYCNFNRGLFDADLKRRYLGALLTEIGRKADGSPADTIFFGGGTPSLLEPSEVESVVEDCRNAFALAPGAEITLEVNPETVPATGCGHFATRASIASVSVSNLFATKSSTV